MTPITVLYATDGSPGAGQALDLLLASFAPAGLHLVDVISVSATAVPRPPAGDQGTSGATLEAGYRQAAEEVVHLAAQRLREAGFAVTETVVAGHPADSIVTHAQASRPDLVVLGARGLSGIRRRLVGSVSGKVARYAPTSVLVARSPGPLQRVVLGYDASPDADRALELIATLPLRSGVDVTVCAAYEVTAPLCSGIAPTMIAQVNAAHRDSLRWAREAADAIAAIAVERLADSGLEASSRIAHGSPHEQLAVAVSELGADLVVVGSRGLSGIERFFLGSTSAALVAQPPTSLLVARSFGDQP